MQTKNSLSSSTTQTSQSAPGAAEIASTTAGDPRAVRTLTNSPGCQPAALRSNQPTPNQPAQAASDQVETLSRAELLDLFGAGPVVSREPHAPSISEGPSIPEGPSTSETPRPRRMRRAVPALRRHSADARPTVCVDAWATPASVSWTRTRKTIRKVSRRPQSTDWALPY